jgi:hypothetical protein
MKRPAIMATPVTRAPSRSSRSRPYRSLSRPTSSDPAMAATRKPMSDSDACCTETPTTTVAKRKMYGRIPSMPAFQRALPSRNRRGPRRLRRSRQYASSSFGDQLPSSSRVLVLVLTMPAHRSPAHRRLRRCPRPGRSCRPRARQSRAAKSVMVVVTTSRPLPTTNGSHSRMPKRSPPATRPKATPARCIAPSTPCTAPQRRSASPR